MIIVDIDGVIADSTHSIQNLACSLFGLDASEYVRVPDEYDVFGHFPEHLRGKLNDLRVEAFQDCFYDVYSDAPPIWGIVNLLHQIDETYMISAYVTVRPPRSAEVTAEYLSRLGVPNAPIIHTLDKAEVCRRLYARYAIEDNYEYAQMMARAGVRVMLLEYPYNDNYPYPHITRVTPETLMAKLKEAHHGVGA